MKTEIDRKVLLSTLWIFALLNYLYCDYIGLLDPVLLKEIMTGTLEGGIQINQGFLLGASILMEIPIAMVLLSRLLKHKYNRYANIIAGTIMTIVQISSLFIGTLTMYYAFFSIIEIATTSSIAYLAWTWKE